MGWLKSRFACRIHENQGLTLTLFAYLFSTKLRAIFCSLGSKIFILKLITTPLTASSFLYFLAASTHGFSFKALIEREILPSFTSITFTFILSPTLEKNPWV